MAHASEIEILKKGKKGSKTTSTRPNAQPITKGEGKDISIE